MITRTEIAEETIGKYRHQHIWTREGEKGICRTRKQDASCLGSGRIKEKRKSSQTPNTSRPLRQKKSVSLRTGYQSEGEMLKRKQSERKLILPPTPPGWILKYRQLSKNPSPRRGGIFSREIKETRESICKVQAYKGSYSLRLLLSDSKLHELVNGLSTIHLFHLTHSLPSSMAPHPFV